MLGDLIVWPPPDTDRNRFLFRAGLPVAAVAAGYVLTFAIVSGGWLPYLAAAILLALTMMIGIGLLLMRARRHEVARAEEEIRAGRTPHASGPGPGPR